MGVIDGQAVNAANTNSAFLAKNADDTATSKINLANTDPDSGAAITNVQKEINLVKAHGARTDNPHAVTAAQVGKGTAQWNADKIKDVTVDDAAKGDGKGLVYDAGSGTLKYAVSAGGALVITGTRTVPQNIVAGTGIAFTGAAARQLWFVQGSGGHVSVSANPQIAAGEAVGQELILIGRNDDQTVTLSEGSGLSINGTWTGAANSVLYLVWDGSVWVEVPRR